MRTLFVEQLVLLNIVVVGNNLDDAFIGDGSGFDIVAHVGKNLLRGFYSDGRVHEGGVCYYFIVGTLDFTDVGGDVGGQQGDDLSRQDDIVRCGLVRRIAIRVSKSGVWISAVRPDQNGNAGGPLRFRFRAEDGHWR